MSRRIKRDYLRKTNTKGEEAKVYLGKGDNKGQVRFNLLEIEDKVHGEEQQQQQQQQQNDSQEDLFDKLRSSPMKQNVTMKPLSFWSKKLQDLECEETKKKTTKLGLYEFSASEDSFSPNKRKKKIKRKYPIKKKKQCEFPLIINKKGEKDPKLKIDKTVKKSKEKTGKRAQALTENKENDVTHNSQLKCSDLSMNFFTSTPAPNKSRLLNSSNFIVLSPIEYKKEGKNENDGKNNVVPEPQQQATTPKISKKTNKNPQEEGKCLRVLRSRKIVIP